MILTSYALVNHTTRFWQMMTSSNGNIFRVTGPLCEEFTGHGEFPTQRPVTRNFDVFFDLRLNNGWVNNREAGDLRRHSGHYDVSVMKHSLITARHISFYFLHILTWFKTCEKQWKLPPNHRFAIVVNQSIVVLWRNAITYIYIVTSFWPIVFRTFLRTGKLVGYVSHRRHVDILLVDYRVKFTISSPERM